VDPAVAVERFWQDWATETHTCSLVDIEQEAAAAAHPAYGDATLRQAWWQGRLHFAGSETAQRGGGYLEGALGAAGRVRAQLPTTAAARERESHAANDESGLAPA